MMVRLARAYGRSLLVVLAPLLVIGMITAFTGAWMGVRAVPQRPPVAVGVERDGQTIALTLHNPSQYRLRAEYGFILRMPDGVPLFRSDPQQGGVLAINERRTFAFALPPGVPRDGWVLEAWAREVVPVLENAATRPETLVEPGAVARRAPMSISGVRVETGDARAIVVDLRLTGATAQPIRIRYAISLTRVQVQDNGALAPLERGVMGRFTELILLPDASRTFTERMSIPIQAGDYAVTLWVQRATGEAGVFEHFAQFTSPQIITIP